MLKAGSIMLTIWSGINFLLAALILTSVVVFKADSPLLVMVFQKAEIAALDAQVIAALNTLTILYNSCSIVVSVLAWIIIRRHLVNGQKWAFWVLLSTIGFVEVMAFIASAQVGHARWQVNIVLSALYVVGIGLSGYAIYKPTSRSTSSIEPGRTICLKPHQHLPSWRTAYRQRWKLTPTSIGAAGTIRW